MPRTGWSPSTVPYGADQTVYLVIDRFKNGTVYRETGNSMTRFASSPSTRWSIGLMTFPKRSRKKFRRGATLQARPCPSISKTSLIPMLVPRGSYRCDFERRENAGHFSAKARAEKRPQQRGL